MKKYKKLKPLKYNDDELDYNELDEAYIGG